MKKLFLLISLFLLIKPPTFSQSFNSENIAMRNFITRMYNSQPWSGVKVFLDYENKYLISLVELNPANYKTENEMVRVAEIKSRSQVSQFLNGSYSVVTVMNRAPFSVKRFAIKQPNPNLPVLYMS